MDRDWGQCRMKQLSVQWWTQPFLLMIENNHMSIFSDHTRLNSHNQIKLFTFNAHFRTGFFSPSKHWATMEIETLSIAQDWHGYDNFARVTASSRHLTRFGKDWWLNRTSPPRRVRRRKLEKMRKAHRRLQSWHRRVARVDRRTKQRLSFCEMTDSRESSFHASSSNESDADDFDNGTVVDQHDTIMGERIIVSNRLIMAKSLATFGWWQSRDSWDPSEHNNWRWLPSHTDHSQDTDGHNPHTTGEHHDSHHLHSKLFVSVFCNCESFTV